jgi:hypothetical protein
MAGADADALFAHHSNAYDCASGTRHHGPNVRAERFIAACRQMADDGSEARLAMDRISDGTFVGWCSLTRWNPGFRIASMGCSGASGGRRPVPVGSRHTGS